MAPWISLQSRWRRAMNRGEVLEGLVDAEELDLGPEPPDAPPRLALDARARGARVQLAEAVFGGRERVVHRAREQAVEQKELDGRRGVDRVAVRAQVRLVRRAAAQRRGPARAAERVAVTRRQQAGQHVDPFEAAPEHEEPPAVVAAHRRVDDAVRGRGPRLDPQEELVAGRPGARPGPRR
jgi:hypothetical protein